jgi:uncharacterized protein DUF6916
MSLTRRRFIETASLTVLAGSVLPASLAQNLHELKDDPFAPERLTLFYGVSPLTFKSLIGDSFEASSADRSPGSLELMAVKEYEPEPEKAPTKGRWVGPHPQQSEQKTNCFSLRFQGSGEALPQGTYTLHHDAIGSFPLFIVPGRSETGASTYTAIFNLLNPANRL